MGGSGDVPWRWTRDCGALLERRVTPAESPRLVSLPAGVRAAVGQAMLGAGVADEAREGFATLAEEHVGVSWRGHAEMVAEERERERRDGAPRAADPPPLVLGSGRI
jgi:hypothetical protein